MENLVNFFNQPYFYIPFLLWSIFWKGTALWKAASKKQLIWFTLILILNTMGLVEILYVFYLNKWDIDNGRILKFLNQKFSKKK